MAELFCGPSQVARLAKAPDVGVVVGAALCKRDDVIRYARRLALASRSAVPAEGLDYEPPLAFSHSLPSTKAHTGSC